MTQEYDALREGPKEYPEILTAEQFDSIGWNFTKDVKDEYFDSSNNHSSTSNAAKYVWDLCKMLTHETSDEDEDNPYVIYTMCDPEGEYRIKGSDEDWDDYPIYLKGFHLVNRIGVWVIVKHDDPESIDVSKLEWKYDE